MRLEEIAGDIKIAEAELALAEDELKWTKELVARKGHPQTSAKPARTGRAPREDRARESAESTQDSA